jgi:hypothetical protein
MAVLAAKALRARIQVRAGSPQRIERRTLDVLNEAPFHMCRTKLQILRLPGAAPKRQILPLRSRNVRPNSPRR